MPLVRRRNSAQFMVITRAYSMADAEDGRLWLVMIGVPIRDPKTPGLVIVKVPFCTSSGLSFLLLARSPRSLMARATPSSDSSSVCLITGTISPQSSATAIPMLISRLNSVLSPETAEGGEE